MLNGVIVLCQTTLGSNVRGGSGLRYHPCNHVRWLLLTGHIFIYSLTQYQLCRFQIWSRYFFLLKNVILGFKMYRVCVMDKLLFWCVKSCHVTIPFQYLLLCWQLAVVTVALVILCHFKKNPLWFEEIKW